MSFKKFLNEKALFSDSLSLNSDLGGARWSAYTQKPEGSDHEN